MENIYREEILEHYQSPQNFSKLSLFDISSKQTNLLCGDEIEIFVKFTNTNVRRSRGVATNTPLRCILEEISFLGKGCAICIASTSILTEYAKKKTKNQLTKFSEEDMLELLGIQVSQTRKKCALLGLYVLRDCLS